MSYFCKFYRNTSQATHGVHFVGLFQNLARGRAHKEPCIFSQLHELHSKFASTHPLVLLNYTLVAIGRGKNSLGQCCVSAWQ